MLKAFTMSCVQRLILSFALFAGGNVTAQSVQVQEPWVRATVKGQQATGAFMKLSTDSPMRLIQVQSPVAGLVEIHEMKMDKDVMKMAAIAGLDLPAGRAVELKPGGFHVMLMQLKQEIKEGETVPLTLVFESKDGKRQTLDVKATTRALGQPMTHKH
ncbi:MAG: copper chaperone PCu(A)C [Betaproteobacteria bacterium]|nr:copper chaperone PCu(A)C [Betaproteobacteria bacterium]